MRLTKRPWGDFKKFVSNKKCSVKILDIKKNQSLSLQKHRKRRETWYFLTSGWVQVGDKIWKAKAGETVKVEKMKQHKIFSKGSNIKVLEITFGKFEEDDEIRLEDKYGRS